MSWGPGKERRGLKIAVFFGLVLRMLYERETDFEVRILGIWYRGVWNQDMYLVDVFRGRTFQTKEFSCRAVGSATKAENQSLGVRGAFIWNGKVGKVELCLDSGYR